MWFRVSDHALKVRTMNISNENYCVCKPEKMGDQDYKCPCAIFLTTGECCCSMFIKGEPKLPTEVYNVMWSDGVEVECVDTCATFEIAERLKAKLHLTEDEKYNEDEYFVKRKELYKEDTTVVDIKNIKFFSGDLRKEVTILEFLKELLGAVWEKKKDFKRPWGNSDWDGDLIVALIKTGLIKGELDEDGYIESSDDNAAHKIIQEIIQAI